MSVVRWLHKSTDTNTALPRLTRQPNLSRGAAQHLQPELYQSLSGSGPMRFLSAQYKLLSGKCTQHCLTVKREAAGGGCSCQRMSAVAPAARLHTRSLP